MLINLGAENVVGFILIKIGGISNEKKYAKECNSGSYSWSNGIWVS